ncbi:unnamed protein product [Arctia plantaginis]|uniref:PEHE domain-containing protein n=1 Tax=Arctia plantaginis TaxID=874455 RepID=A0A8S0YYV4_ARCPL|nr:unnamed protein product [Arctia plantaginis]
MNSRSSVNESNLVNLSANLATLEPLETKDSLSLSFPFDHIYACHSEGSDRRQTLSLDKDVEISSHCVVTDQKDLVVSSSTEISRLTERLTAAETQNKKLKDLLVYHLDLIQQQNDVITKREKLYQALKQENDTLKSKVNRVEKKTPASQKQTISFPAPIVHVPPVVTTPVVKTEPGTSSSQVMFNSFTELLLPDNRTNPYILNEITKPITYAPPDPFNINRPQETDVPSYLSNLGVTSILDEPPSDNLTMIENKRSSFVKKETKPEPRPEPLYTVTSNSGNPIIQKIQRTRRRTTSSIGSLNRMPKTPVVKVEPPETELKLMFDDDKSFERSFSVNKKSKMINTYGKSKTTTIPKRTTHFSGSLSERFQLIDTTPTGEDPYQLGEADMREQSPIPKLMLQKSNHGRTRLCSDLMGDNASTSSNFSSTRRIYEPPATETSTKASKIKLESRYNLPSIITEMEIKKEIDPEPSLPPMKTTIVHEPDLDIVKTETEIDWRLNSTALYDFSCGDSDSSQTLPRLNPEEFERLLETETSEEAKKAADVLENIDMKTLDYCASVAEKCDSEKSVNEKIKKRVARTANLLAPDFVPNESSDKRGTESKRGRKRAHSTTGLSKTGRQTQAKTAAGPKPPKIPRTKAPANRGRKSPVPGMVSTTPYHTLVGDPDISWYFGLDPEIKMEDLDQPGQSTISTVEVPRWREKPYTSCYTLEGTENLDDKVFEKRHQKLEAEERRQLRWHMRRIREQRHVERLRQRQRDSWCSGLTSSAYQQPSMYTIWPQPQRDVRVVEITDTLPVMAFGEDLPLLPPADFMLPWVRTSKALKRSKRSKTLH